MHVVHKGFLTKSNLAQIDHVTEAKKVWARMFLDALFATEPQTWGWFAQFWLAKPLQKHLVESVPCRFESEVLLNYKPNKII